MALIVYTSKLSLSLMHIHEGLQSFFEIDERNSVKLMEKIFLLL